MKGINFRNTASWSITSKNELDQLQIYTKSENFTTLMWMSKSLSQLNLAKFKRNDANWKWH